ncbi:MAG: nicotinate-nucleotide--dimethylbenzimidazole phosphoribosyltransferase [Chitinophagaceae bacterium]
MSVAEQLQRIINHKTKPLGALGLLETIALQMGVIQNSIQPTVSNPHMVVFAADHGIAATGLVNPYPQAVTAQMVLNFLQGGAAINVFTKQHQIGLIVVDAGVNEDFDEDLYNNHFLNLKIDYGTNNYLEKNACTEEQVHLAIKYGKNIVDTLAEKECNTIGFGEMGIGNTSAASLIMSAITGIAIEECVGRGTGVTDEQLSIKIDTLVKVFQKHQLQFTANKPILLLAKIGGFEIAMMVGAYLQAAKQNMVIVVDGFIATAALLVALKIDETVIHNCVFAHSSSEKGHEQMLEYLQAKPLLNLGLRLGEGTGAALAIPLLQSAALMVQEMASFESANISSIQ